MKVGSEKNLWSKNNDPFSIQEGRIKDGKIPPIYRLSWTEEMFSSGNMEGGKLGRTFDFSKLKSIVFLLVISLLVLLGRAAWLQVVRGDYYSSMAEGNRVRIERVDSTRGVIYDTNKKPLVHNVANFLLYFIPADLPRDEMEKQKIIKRVGEIIGQKPEAINKILEPIKRNSAESFNPLFITDNVEYEKAMLLYLEADNMPGVFLSNRTRREYNLVCQSLSHVLGYTGKISESELKKSGKEYSPIDYIGKMGIENFWENELRGINGQKYLEVDALGKEKKIISYTKPQDGNNLVLSIDQDAQKKLEEIISAYLSKAKLTRASAVVINPNNGEIISLISLPDYDDNLFANGISAVDYKKLTDNPDNPLFNRSISGEFPSGSVIKPVLAAAALEEGVINENTSFLSTGGIRVGQWFFPDWKAGGHGITNVRKAIAQSVNTFFYIIGGGYQDFVGLGPERIGNYEKLFGFGSELGIDLPGEASGFIPTKEWKEKTTGERWYIGNTYNISIGQGDTLVTPLQIADMTAFFANGGTLYQPHLVRQILSSDDKLVKNIEPKIIKENIIKDYNIKIVREGMRQTVTSGSASSLQAVPVAVAGKTGTAQWSTKKGPHAWFTGFAPYDNPQLAITILVEEGVEGSRIAVPIAKEFLTWYFSKDKASSTDQQLK